MVMGMTESNMKKDEQQDCQWDVLGRSRRHLRHTYYMCKCKECGFTREIRSEYIKTIRCEACTKRWVSHCNTIDDFWKFKIVFIVNFELFTILIGKITQYISFQFTVIPDIID